MVIFFVYVNIATIFLMFFNKLVSCFIPYFNFNLFSIEDGLALALNSLGLFTYMELTLTNFANLLGRMIHIKTLKN